MSLTEPGGTQSPKRALLSLHTAIGVYLIKHHSTDVLYWTRAAHAALRTVLPQPAVHTRSLSVCLGELLVTFGHVLL